MAENNKFKVLLLSSIPLALKKCCAAANGWIFCFIL